MIVPSSVHPNGLVVHARKWFLSVDNYGGRQPALIFTVIASPPKPQSNFVESLSRPRCVFPKTILVRPRQLVGFFKNFPEMFPYGLVVHARKWFRSVDKYGGRQPALILTDKASPPKPLEEFCRNLSYERLSTSRCVCPKMILVRQQIWPNSGHLFYNNLVIASPPRPLVDFLETCLRFFTSGLVVSTRKWFRSDNKYGSRSPSLINLLIAFFCRICYSCIVKNLVKQF